MTYVYRYFDRDGALLYVGASDDWEVRLKNHQRYADWFPKAHQLCIEWHSTREAALAAERAAIRCEWPLYNVAGSPWKTGHVLAATKDQRSRERIGAVMFEPMPERATAEWEAYDRAVWAAIRAQTDHCRHLINTRITTYARDLVGAGGAS